MIYQLRHYLGDSSYADISSSKTIEIMLVKLEIIRHRELARQLKTILDIVRLTDKQKDEVKNQIRISKRTLCALYYLKYQLRKSITLLTRR